MKLHSLHLSDLHLKGRDSAGKFIQDAVTDSMLSMISEMENKPDFVIVQAIWLTVGSLKNMRLSWFSVTNF